MRKRVMAVDDSATVRQVLRMTLEGAGYEVVDAVDGRDVVDKMSIHQFDILVTDLNMLNMDDLDLIRHVRQTPGCRFLPIIHADHRIAAREEAGKQAGRGLGVDRQAVSPRAVVGRHQDDLPAMSVL